MSRQVAVQGPIAYLGRDTVDGRRILRLAATSPVTLLSIPDPVSSRVPPVSGGDLAALDAPVPVGEITEVWLDDGKVMARGRADLPEWIPAGARVGVGIDVRDAVVVYRDSETGELLTEVDDVVAEQSVVEFTDCTLMAVTLRSDPAWPDAYMEVACA